MLHSTFQLQLQLEHIQVPVERLQRSLEHEGESNWNNGKRVEVFDSDIREKAFKLLSPLFIVNSPKYKVQCRGMEKEKVEKVVKAEKVY